MLPTAVIAGPHLPRLHLSDAIEIQCRQVPCRIVVGNPWLDRLHRTCSSSSDTNPRTSNPLVSNLLTYPVHNLGTTRILPTMSHRLTRLRLTARLSMRTLSPNHTTHPASAESQIETFGERMRLLTLSHPMHTRHLRLLNLAHNTPNNESRAAPLHLPAVEAIIMRPSLVLKLIPVLVRTGAGARMGVVRAALLQQKRNGNVVGGRTRSLFRSVSSATTMAARTVLSVRRGRPVPAGGASVRSMRSHPP